MGSEGGIDLPIGHFHKGHDADICGQEEQRE